VEYIIYIYIYAIQISSVLCNVFFMQVQWVWTNLVVLHGVECMSLHQAGPNQIRLQRMTVLFVWSQWRKT
jgi:hypothetical protein